MTDIVNNIYQVFKDYYGENNVDLQFSLESKDIIVFWNTVTITNEFNESVDIYDLYAKISISDEGKLLSSPSFIRGRYTSAQWDSGYMHSHIHPISNVEYKRWNSSCLGSGPINHTIAKLKGRSWSQWNAERRDYDSFNYEEARLYEDLIVWTLFVFELDKYVHVESVEGVPYIKMNTIGNNGRNKDSLMSLYPARNILHNEGDSFELFKKFIPELLDRKILKFAYKNNNFVLGNSNAETILEISNTFIDWYNKPENRANRLLYPFSALCCNSNLLECIYVDGNLYQKRTSLSARTPLVAMLNTPLGFSFKGQEISLKMVGAAPEAEVTTIYVLSPYILSNIIYRILRIINTKYGKSTSTINRKSKIL